MVASYRGERDIAVGNVVGSNLFNVLCVVGLGSTNASSGINVSSSALQFDLPIMIVVCFACLPIFFMGSSLTRWEGGVFLGFYIAYTTYLILDASGHGYGPMLGIAMGFVIVPLAAITIAVLLFRFCKQQQTHVRSSSG